MKFVIVSDKGCDLAIIFDEIISHGRFAHMQPSAAGFCRVETGDISCWGKSTALNIDAKPEYSLPILMDSVSRHI